MTDARRDKLTVWMSAMIRRQQLLKLHPFPVVSKQQIKKDEAQCAAKCSVLNQMKNFRQTELPHFKDLEMTQT